MDLHGINLLDVILAGAVIISALVGLARGLVKEILSLAAWVIALWLAYLFAQQLADQLIQKFIADKLLSYITSFGIIFLIGLLAVGLLNMLITSLLNAVGMTGFDRLLGLLFGVARGAILCALLVFFGNFVPALTQEGFWQQSKLVPSFMNLANWGVAMLPDNIRELVNTQNQKNLQMAAQAAQNIAAQTTENADQTPQPIDIQLQSLGSDNAQSLGSATRPQLSNEQQAQQNSQTNTLASQPDTDANSDDNQSISLQSLSVGADDAPTVPASSNSSPQNAPHDTSSVPPLKLESTQ